MRKPQPQTRVDHTALKVNQAFIVGLLTLAFILGKDPAGVWLVLFVAMVLAVGTIFPSAGLFKLVYSKVLKPAGILKPKVVPDDPAPHLFAQGLGAVFLFASLLAFAAGSVVAGWLLTWIVIALAFINLTVSFCAGCFVFYQLKRRGLLPFQKQATQP